MKNEITKLLINKFSDIYCDNCNYENTDICEDCNRKAMMWKISESYAKEVAEDINNIIIKQKEK